jgi:hypothetical protein
MKDQLYDYLKQIGWLSRYSNFWAKGWKLLEFHPFLAGDRFSLLHKVQTGSWAHPAF